MVLLLSLVMVVMLPGFTSSKGSAGVPPPSPLHPAEQPSDEAAQMRRQQKAAAKAQAQKDKVQDQQPSDASGKEENAATAEDDFDKQDWVQGIRQLRNFAVMGEDLCLCQAGITHSLVYGT